MRIVHVASFYGPRSDGLRATLERLGEGYRRAGHEFFVIAPGRRGGRAETASGTRITIPLRPVAGAGPSLVPVDFAIRRTLDELVPDRLEVSDRMTVRRLGAWAARRGIPAVVFSHTAPADWVLKLALPRAGRPGTAPLAAYDRIVCTTDAAAEQFESRLPGMVTRLRLGVDLEVFSPLRWSADLRRRSLRGASVLLVHAGRLSPEKSPERSIATLAELLRRGVDARLVVAGDGPARPQLELAAAGLPVAFLGHLDSPRELAALLASADVVLSPGEDGTFCLCALEALACGTPVVAPASSAVSELLAGGVGDVTGSTASGLADGVQRVLARRVEDRRGDARARAAGYPWRGTVDSMLAIHTQLGAPLAPLTVG
jgi:alpha-1,6-mannosyltransferase